MDFCNSWFFSLKFFSIFLYSFNSDLISSSLLVVSFKWLLLFEISSSNFIIFDCDIESLFINVWLVFIAAGVIEALLSKRVPPMGLSENIKKRLSCW